MRQIEQIKEKVFGPRIPREIIFRDRFRFVLPTILMGLAALFLLISMFLPYWRMEMNAPQYPSGLSMTIYVNDVQGDIQEVDNLNHYIGMRPLSEAGQFERSMAVIAVTSLIFLVVASIFIHNPCALLLTWPVILYPVIFLLDLWFWMRKFGTELDPKAPFSGAIEPFVPPILGEGVVGQFKTNAIWESGLWMAAGASVLIMLGLYFSRRAYKPLRDEVRAAKLSAENL